MSAYPASSQLATIAKIRSIADHSSGTVADWRPIANRARTCVQSRNRIPRVRTVARSESAQERWRSLLFRLSQKLRHRSEVMAAGGIEAYKAAYV